MKIGKICFYISLLVCVIFALICWLVPFNEILSIKENIVVTKNISKNENLGNFGSLVTTRYNEENETVDFLLFNAVKIHSVNAITAGDRVYLGGQTLGFSYQGDGVLVVSKSENADDKIQSGDIIKSINGKDINKISTITEILNKKDNLGKEIQAKIMRNGALLNTKLKPAYDVLSKKYKLGVWAKESISGIGTLTFINPKNSRFGALGHPILEPNTKKILDVGNGNVHKCCVLGVKKATRGVPGEMRGVFVHSKKEIGEVDKNCDYGIFGTLNIENSIFDNKKTIELGGRLSAHPGKAKIYSSIDGKTIRGYDVEIIKTNYKSAKSPKSLVFKVVDKNLINITGGIVQGMSGSPIVQDGKLIGAVTHVFVNDSTKGFGIYIDNMINE